MKQRSVKRTNFGLMGREAKNKLSNDNDIKIIIQGANSQTGIGKTTLAIQLARYIDDHGWSAQEKAFIHTQEYIEAHMDKKKGSALLFDELEGAADSRRSNSYENVELSQAWAKLRARNIATITTLPTTSMLDKRMLELADYWVLVKQRGIAQPYRIVVNDFKPHKLPQRKALPGDEHIRFVDLPDDDEDKQYLDEIKDEMLRSDGPAYIRETDHRKKIKEVKRDTEKDIRDQAIKSVAEATELTHKQISDLDFVDLSQGTVTKIINSE